MGSYGYILYCILRTLGSFPEKDVAPAARQDIDLPKMILVRRPDPSIRGIVLQMQQNRK